MQAERKTYDNNGSLVFAIPKLYADFLEIKPGDDIVIEDMEGKKGRYLTIWKKTIR